MTDKELANRIAGLPMTQMLKKFFKNVLSTFFLIVVTTLFITSYIQIYRDEVLGESLANDLHFPVGSIQIMRSSPQGKWSSSVLKRMDQILYTWMAALEARSSGEKSGMFFLAFFFLSYVVRTGRKRREVFLRNYKKADLAMAQPCTIQKANMAFNIFKIFGDVKSWNGFIFEVKERKGVYVVLNESPTGLLYQLLSKYEGNRKGVLLSYEGHHFFYCETWMDNFDLDTEADD